MTTTTTHDTKRSEDVRARISLLSEIPGLWREAVTRWSARNARYKTGEFPDRNAEYLLYQTLVGAWPIDAGRLNEYMLKATREAKVHTAWTENDEPYEAALKSFVEGMLADVDFIADLVEFVTPAGRSGAAQFPVADAAEADLARRARHLPGQRAVGPEPGRPR